MEFSQSTKIVFDRIQQPEPENVSKIIGYLLLQGYGEREMIQLALGPDDLIHAVINKAKSELGLSRKLSVSTQVPPQPINPVPMTDLPLQYTPFSPAASRPFSSPATFRAVTPYWEPQLVNDHPPVRNVDFVPVTYTKSIEDDYRLHNQAQFMNLEDQLETVNPIGVEFSSNYYYPESTFGSLGTRSSRRSPSLPEFSLKTCHYYNKGFCRHGANCRYVHGPSVSEGFPQIFTPQPSELASDDQLLSPISLEKLEMEIIEILKMRRGMPVSIASLPMMYCERYGKSLQAVGYLTESQRHGKAGHNLTKLLARLNSIRLIDRPHGQHSVILAEDAPRFMEYRSERNDPGAIVPGSRQIYLTFPAESTFTEEDVSNYFKGFGPVQDVRIPCQQKRMFGFVTFLYPETVKMILTKGNPHFVCGARVLVKPYKEKSRLIDRKSTEKFESTAYYPHFLDMDPELHSMPRDNSRLLGNKLIEEQEKAIEFDQRRLSEFQLTPKPLGQGNLVNPMQELKLAGVHADHNDLYTSNRFNYLFDALNIGSTSDDKTKNTGSNYSDQESSQGLNLPESPFASPIAS
ncbi:hypothetical protein AAC387_Pa02g1287 [Persea americana]